jgi:ATP-dependent Clp protease ATP-binding subunit ClpC
MLQRFTAGARRAVVLAREEAASRRHAAVTPEHLLLGLIRDGVGLAVHAMQRLGLGLEAAKTAAERALADAETAPQGSEPAFAPATKRVLELALRSGREPGPHRVGTEGCGTR